MTDTEIQAEHLASALLNSTNRMLDRGVAPEVIARAAMAHALSVGEQTFGPVGLAQWLREAAERVEDVEAARLAANARGLN